MASSRSTQIPHLPNISKPVLLNHFYNYSYKILNMDTKNFELIADGVPYEVKAKPFMFNDELRFKVTYNDSEEYIFTQDAEAGQLMAIDDAAVDIPDNLEEAMAEKLNSITV